MENPSPQWLAKRHWQEQGQVIDITVDPSHRTVVVFDGKGSMAGAQALIDLVESIRDELGHHILITALVDMRRLDGAPLRAQFTLGKWLLMRRKQMDKIAIFGGKPFEMGIARAVMTIAGMGSKANFGNHLEQALAFLGWPRERYPI
jgi:hypothetical protein